MAAQRSAVEMTSKANPSAGLIYGIGPVREILAASPREVKTLYIRYGYRLRFADEAAAVVASGGRVIEVEEARLAEMTGGQARHQGIAAELASFHWVTLETLIASGADPLLLIDEVTDPQNLGALLRSAECAGVAGVILARDRTSGITPVVIKSSAGAWAHLKIARCGNVATTVEQLKRGGYWIAALSPKADTTLYELDCDRRLVMVVGSEGKGLRKLVLERADFALAIPMYGRVKSLNVAVAAAVVLFELQRRRAQNGPTGPASGQAPFAGPRP